MANIGAAANRAVEDEEDEKRKAQVATGASELLHHRNPFYVTAGRGLFVTIAAFVVAFFGYWLCIYGISTSLVRSVERADPMLEVLRGSSTYTLSNPDLDKAENALVDDLAIAIWIKHYKLVSPDTELVDVLGEPRFELLRAALRYGSHCPAATGQVEPLRTPVVERIVALAAFLAGADCGTASGRGPELASIAIVVRNISAMPVGQVRLVADGTAVAMLCGAGYPISLDSSPFVGTTTGELQGRAPIGCPDLFSSTPQLSGKQVFKIILDRGGTFEHLDVKPPTTFADQSKARGAAESALQAAKSNLETAQGNLKTKEEQLAAGGDQNVLNPEIQALKDGMPALQDAFNKAQAEQAKAVAGELPEEVKWHEQARAILYALNQGRVAGGATSLDDPKVQAIEDFAIALMASVDTDANVTGARQLLAAARGAEQFLIVALFMMVGALMLERVLAFRRRGWEIDRATSQIKANVAASDADAEKARLEAEAAAAKAAEKAAAKAAAKGAAALAAGLPAPQPAASAAKPGDDLQDRRTRQTERASRLRTTIATLNLHIGSGQDRTSEVSSDMVNAVLNDLSQTSIYGLSDERTDKVAEDLKVKVDSSRQLIGWGITTLPALGFLGTVHGILNALNGVSGLTQGDAAARLATLLNVSGALGLAFSTTLIALVGMMILTFFDIVQARSEKSMIEEFRDFLNDRVLG